MNAFLSLSFSLSLSLTLSLSLSLSFSLSLFCSPFSSHSSSLIFLSVRISFSSSSPSLTFFLSLFFLIYTHRHNFLKQLLDCRNIANLFRGVPRTPNLFLSLQLVHSALKNNTRCLLPPPPTEELFWESIAAKKLLTDSIETTIGK